MRNCLVCGHPFGSCCYLVLQGRFDESARFLADDDTGIICEECMEEIRDSGGGGGLTVGKTTIVAK